MGKVKYYCSVCDTLHDDCKDGTNCDSCNRNFCRRGETYIIKNGGCRDGCIEEDGDRIVRPEGTCTCCKVVKKIRQKLKEGEEHTLCDECMNRRYTVRDSDIVEYFLQSREEVEEIIREQKGAKRHRKH